MDETEKITLAVGQEYGVTLPGMGSAGYVWNYTLEGDAAAVEIIRSRVGERPAVTPEAPMPSSYDMDDRFTLRAIAGGQVTVHLTQRRPWEQAQPPLNQRIIEVLITT